MTDTTDSGVEALLSEEIVSLAASTFVAAFTGIGLGHEQAQSRIDNELNRRFGKPRRTGDHYAYQAVILQIVLVWEQARIAARAHPGVLIALPDGVRLLGAADAADELRALLAR